MVYKVDMTYITKIKNQLEKWGTILEVERKEKKDRKENSSLEMIG